MADFTSHVIEFDLTNDTFQNTSLERVGTADPVEKIYWIHCQVQQFNQETLQQIMRKFKLPLDAQRVLRQSERSQTISDTSDSLTLKIQDVLQSTPDLPGVIPFADLIIHLTKGFCLTITSRPLSALEELNKHFQDTLPYAKTPGFLMFLILDNVINNYTGTLFDLEKLADAFDIHQKQNQSTTYGQVIFIKKQIIKTKRHLTNIRDLLMRISGRKMAVISEDCRLSLINLLEHAKIIIAESDAIRDLLKGTLGQMDNALMQRMNQSIMVLTTFASILLPLSLVAGLLGMNFQYMPPLLSEKYGFYITLGGLALLGSFILIGFRKKRWI